MYNSDTDPGGDSSDLEKGGGSNVTPNPNNAALTLSEPGMALSGVD